MTEQTRNLLISLASHMAYMQGQLEARHELDDPEHWATVEAYAQQVSSTDDCLLELRARVEALEAGANCPHVVTSAEGTSYCALAEQTQDKLDRLIEMDRAAPAQADSLVKRVGMQFNDGNGDDKNARAAIREVAAWLRSQDLSTGDYWAGRLEQEAGR